MLEYTQMLENINKKLEKTVQLLHDSTIKLQAKLELYEYTDSELTEELRRVRDYEIERGGEIPGSIMTDSLITYAKSLENENEKLRKSVQFLNDSTIKLHAKNDALSKALLTCSVKHQELQVENQALRETILGEVTTADEFNSEFRHNPDDDAPDAKEVEDKRIQYKGAIKHFRRLTNKRGEQMAKMLLDSDVELVIFPRVLNDNKFLLEELIRSDHKATFNCSIISANSRTDIILNSVVTNASLSTSDCVTCGQEHSTHRRSDDKYYCSMCWTVNNS